MGQFLFYIGTVSQTVRSRNGPYKRGQSPFLLTPGKRGLSPFWSDPEEA